MYVRSLNESAAPGEDALAAPSLLDDYSMTPSFCCLVRQQIQVVRQFGGLGAFTHSYVFAHLGS